MGKDIDCDNVKNINILKHISSKDELTKVARFFRMFVY